MSKVHKGTIFAIVRIVSLIVLFVSYCAMLTVLVAEGISISQGINFLVEQNSYGIVQVVEEAKEEYGFIALGKQIQRYSHDLDNLREETSQISSERALTKNSIDTSLRDDLNTKTQNFKAGISDEVGQKVQRIFQDMERNSEQAQNQIPPAFVEEMQRMKRDLIAEILNSNKTNLVAFNDSALQIIFSLNFLHDTEVTNLLSPWIEGSNLDHATILPLINRKLDLERSLSLKSQEESLISRQIDQISRRRRGIVIMSFILIFLFSIPFVFKLIRALNFVSLIVTSTMLRVKVKV
jgi:gas vesicle protein